MRLIGDLERADLSVASGLLRRAALLLERQALIPEATTLRGYADQLDARIGIVARPDPRFEHDDERKQ